ncbi:hypothetical protein E2C01_019932 [Portunus trituberculatus]|uniref:Uncharacterized protein n=1 Tax=Portunus trituberculatus TaxID=210409 RepID=A0A5B7E1S3_PORTR|nr:hypothetical protein [Portunus trituberculatus]
MYQAEVKARDKGNSQGEVKTKSRSTVEVVVVVVVVVVVGVWMRILVEEIEVWRKIRRQPVQVSVRRVSGGGGGGGGGARHATPTYSSPSET